MVAHQDLLTMTRSCPLLQPCQYRARCPCCTRSPTAPAQHQARRGNKQCGFMGDGMLCSWGWDMWDLEAISHHFAS